MAVKDDKMRPIGTHPVNKQKKGNPRKRRINKRRKNKKRLSKALKPQETKMYTKDDRYTFMYRYRAVLSYFSDYHELTTVHVEFLIGAYATEHFKADELSEALLIPHSWRRKGFNILVRKGFIKVYISGNRKAGESDSYKLTKKGSVEINRFYKMLLGEIDFPAYY